MRVYYVIITLACMQSTLNPLNFGSRDQIQSAAPLLILLNSREGSSRCRETLHSYERVPVVSYPKLSSELVRQSR